MPFALRPTRHRPIRHATFLLGVALIGLNLLVNAMAWLGLRQARHHSETQAGTNARNLARVLERNLAGDIHGIDLALSAVIRELSREQAAGEGSGPALEAFIQDTFSRHPSLDSLRTANAAGEIDHGIGVLPGSHASIADRDYFQILKQEPALGLVLSKPVLGRISQKWVIVLARRLDTASGDFAGVVYGVITLDAFTRSLGLVDPGPHGTVSLWDRDLGLVTRFPFAKGSSDRIGDRILVPAFRAMVSAGQEAGTYTSVTPVDGVRRTFSYQRVGNLPLYVDVGLASEDYLAQWRRDAWTAAGFVSMFALLSSFLGLLLHRAWRHHEQRIKELSRALEEVRTLQDFLPICMYCKKIRDDQNYWSQIESYITEQTGTTFSHGICPDCRVKALDGFRPPSTERGGEPEA